MEDFDKKVKLTETMEIEEEPNDNSSNTKTLELLRRFLAIQQRRAQAYAKLKQYALIILLRL